MVLSTAAPSAPFSRYFMSQICCEIEATLGMAFTHLQDRARATTRPGPRLPRTTGIKKSNSTRASVKAESSIFVSPAMRERSTPVTVCSLHSKWLSRLYFSSYSRVPHGRGVDWSTSSSSTARGRLGGGDQPRRGRLDALLELGHDGAPLAAWRDRRQDLEGDAPGALGKLPPAP